MEPPVSASGCSVSRSPGHSYAVDSVGRGGDVEVDETFICGVKTGRKRRRRAPGKADVLIAVGLTCPLF